MIVLNTSCNRDYLYKRTKWVTKIFGYDFEIIYKKKDNKIWWQMLSP